MFEGRSAHASKHNTGKSVKPTWLKVYSAWPLNSDATLSDNTKMGVRAVTMETIHTICANKLKIPRFLSAM